METVLQNSPRRNSLSGSPGLEEPIPGDIDVELVEIENPVQIICDQKPELRFTVANLTGEAVTSLTLKIDYKFYHYLKLRLILQENHSLR
jgi:hypothetical protein